MITLESVIIQAYILILQGQFKEAEQIFKNNPEVLKMPSGADLYARLKFESGDKQEAKEIWGRIHNVFPDFQPAILALDAYIDDAKQNVFSKVKCFIIENLSALLLILCAIFCVGFLVLTSFLLHSNNKKIYKQNDNISSVTLTNFVEKVVEIPVDIVITNEVLRECFSTNYIDVVYTNYVDVIKEDAKAIVENTSEVCNDKDIVKLEKQELPSFCNHFNYTVKKDDTVWSLSVKYKFTIPDFISLNDNVDIDFIKIGQQVLMPRSIFSEE